MDKLHEFIAIKRKMFTVMVYAWIVFFGCCMFPINMSRISEDLLFGLLILVAYYDMADIFYGLYKKRPLFVFCSTFLFNTIGLLFRILLEWGEYSITRDLTSLNVWIYLILIPVLVTVFYIRITTIEPWKKSIVALWLGRNILKLCHNKSYHALALFFLEIP